MSKPKSVPTNPVELLETLVPDEIEQRLDELDRESSALRVLLRAARARGKKSPEIHTVAEGGDGVG
jgi:hypothetical protein